MKLKGINVVEANADKLALGLTGLAFVGALGMQFVPGANAIKVGQQTVTPGSAFAPVEEEARRLDAALSSGAPKLPDPPTFGVGSKLTLGANRAVTPRTPLGAAPAIAIAQGNAAPVKGVHALPVVPAPTAPVTLRYAAAVHPVERLQVRGLDALLPPAQPFDVTAVSIESSFDGAALRRALAADPDGEGPTEPINPSWWQDGFEQDLVTIVAVEVERELLARPDGTTPDKPEIVALRPMPGRVDGLGEWTRSVRSLGDVSMMVQTLQSQAEEVQRPRFYQTIAGPAWVSPVEAAEKGDPADRAGAIERSRRNLAELDRRIRQVEDAIAKTPAAPAPGSAPSPRRDTGGGGDGGGGGKGRGGGGAAGGGSPPAGPAANAPKGDRRVLERQLADLHARRAKIIATLASLGENIEGATSAPAPDAAAAKPPASLLASDDVKVWAHDLTGEPGATYRYRTRVIINNPLYGRNLRDEQKGLAEPSLVRGAWSDWSAPTTVHRREYLFVTSAEDRGELAPRPHASAEVFTLYHGYYRRATTQVEPGDVVFGEVKLPDIKLADLARLEAMIKSGDPNLFVQPDAPINPGDGGGGGGKQGPRGRAPMEERGRPTPEATPPADAITGPEWLSVAAAKTIPVSTGVVFVDASPIPGDPTARPRAILREPSGVLMVRSPDAERESRLYKEVQDSEILGRGTKPKPTEPVRPLTPLPTRPATRPGDPGGGGGGGGG